MKLSLSWMREWIEADAGAEEIAEALTRRGFYVEGIETHGPSFTGGVVARVLEVQKHPNADKLSLCMWTRAPVNCGWCAARPTCAPG